MRSPHRRRALARLAIVAALAAATAGTATDGVAAGYDGAARVLTHRQATIVYPRRDDGGLARLSADIRAGFLSTSHGVDVAVLRDDAVTDEALAGNLIVLGWDNALLRREAVGGAPRVGADGWSWLGLASATGDDLVASHRSPFAPARFMTFVSRVDPELDRLSPLPVIGSDWLIMRRYRVVAQGMFGDDPAWPPTIDDVGQLDRRGDPPDRRPAGRSEHYALVAVETSLPDDEARRILAAREEAWSTAVAVLGEPGGAARIEVLVYADDDAKTELTGVPDPWHSDPPTGRIHAVPRAAVSVTPHEDVHVIARRLLGPAYLSALYEGLAIAIERGGDGGALATDAAGLVEAGLVPTVDDLLDEARFRELTARKVAWPAAGLLVEWVLAAHGRDGLARAYGLVDGTAAALAEALGTTPEAVAAGYAAHVETRAAAGRETLARERALADARRLVDAGDVDGGVAAYRALLSAAPDDLGVRYRIGLALLEAGRLDEAERELRELIGRSEPEDGRWHVFARYLLGNTLERAGRVDEALAAWRGMLELPDISGAHRLAREAIARVEAAPENGESPPAAADDEGATRDRVSGGGLLPSRAGGTRGTAALPTSPARYQR